MGVYRLYTIYPISSSTRFQKDGTAPGYLVAGSDSLEVQLVNCRAHEMAIYLRTYSRSSFAAA